MLLVSALSRASSASGNKETLTATVWLLATPSAKPPWAQREPAPYGQSACPSSAGPTAKAALRPSAFPTCGIRDVRTTIGPSVEVGLAQQPAQISAR